jgi:hypothetical protein
MVVQKKRNIQELWKIVRDFTTISDAPEGLFERDISLPLPGITDQFMAIHFYQAIGYAILYRYTNAISRREVFKRFEDTTRDHLGFEIETDVLIPSHNDLLSRLNPDHSVTELEQLSIGDIYQLTSVLANCLDPNMYYPEYYRYHRIYDGIKLMTTLSAYVISGFTPMISESEAKSILTTMVDNYKIYWASVFDPTESKIVKRRLEASHRRTDSAHNQINTIFNEYNK